MTRPSLLEGKAIIVTGSGRGVGRGIAMLAAEQGARVVVNDLGTSAAGVGGDGSVAQQVADEIRAAGGEAVANTDSVADWNSANRMVQQALDLFGRVDGVVNNAGILRDTIFHKMPPEDFESVVRVHLFGSFYLARAAAPYFREQNSGSFVHMTSSSGLVGNFGQANYSAAKMGIVGLSRSIAFDMARFNVNSNCVAPFAWTNLVGTIPTDTPEQQKRVDGLKRLVPERIAPFTVALLTDAGRKVTGQIFGVRNNEIYLFNQPRPIRTAHTSEGWTPASVIERVFPMFEPSLTPLVRSGEFFSWDPV
ncbi:MAG TPA: SDR family NAD(P)-dependent oxidoreductase [Steroidobacteraceae bacterium]|nr:SDR family NAD(P)-dependent oxidoreductase [Steroidobacteraceae bacterium]